MDYRGAGACEAVGWELSMSYAFVSYSKNDREFVEKLVNDLRSNGINAWIDLEIFPVGVSWEKALKEGIKESKALIYVANKNSINSTWMKSEVSQANEMGKSIIVVALDEEGLSQVKDFAGDWVDFRQDYLEGLGSLLKILKSEE